MLILYVTMLGAAVGVRDAGHIGLESLLILVPDGLRLRLEALIHALVGTFGLIMAWNGAVLAESVMAYKTPTLGLSEGINHLPLVIAGVLMHFSPLEHIVALWRDEDVISVVALTILRVVVVACLLLGVPVAFSIGLSAVATILYEGLPLAVVFQRMTSGMNIFSFLAIPSSSSPAS